MALAVWAEALDVPGHVCSDARLRGKKATAVSYPKGASFGQAGWDMGLQFSSLSDLAQKLNYNPVSTPKHVCGNWVFACDPIKRGQVTRLGIHVHGLPGKLFFSGEKNKKMAVTPANVSSFRSDLNAIGLCTSQSGSTILFMGCLAGQGTEGTRLLKAFSKVWPGRRIVAFSTIGFVSGGDQKRPGAACTEPGMRDTNNTSPVLSWAAQQSTYGPIWNNLKKLPWASEKSPHAKVVLNGTIVRGAKL